jgi:hypothetical protein
MFSYEPTFIMLSFFTSFRNHYEYTIILFSARYAASRSIILLASTTPLSSKSTLFKIYQFFISIALRLLSIAFFIIKAHMRGIHIIAGNILLFLVLIRLNFCDQSVILDYATACIIQMLRLGC